MFVDTLMSGLAQEAKVTDLEGQKFKYAGIPAMVDVRGNHLLIVFKTGSRYKVILAEESDYTRKADQVGVLGEGKSGQVAFDDRYVIRADDQTAKSLVEDKMMALLQALEPFLELEMSGKEYRLLKQRPEEPNQVRRDLASLAALVEATRA